MRHNSRSDERPTFCISDSRSVAVLTGSASQPLFDLANGSPATVVYDL